jgi:pimeloyl-ACP methyl ester carboxylesterase
MQFFRGLLIAVIIVFGLITLMQRKLMYPATREPSLTVARFSELKSAFRETVDVELTTADSVKIRGWYLKVQTEPSDRLILFFHGNGGHRAYRVHWYTLAASLKADVLTIDYHGYGDSGGHPSETALVMDAEAVWDYATKQLKYEPSQIFILGESLGGGVAVQLAATACNRRQVPGGMILVATFSSMLDVARMHYWWLPVRLVLTDRYLSDKQIGRVTCPILQFHGDQDALIPIDNGRKLFDAAPTMAFDGKAKLFHTLPRTGHNGILSQNTALIREQLSRFLQ